MYNYYQEYVNRGLSIYLSRLNYIQFNNPKVYQYFNKKGEFAMECFESGQVDNEQYFSYKIANNKKLIKALIKNIKRLNQDNMDSKDIKINCANCDEIVCVLELMFEMKNNEKTFILKSSGFMGESYSKYLGQKEMSIELFKKIRNYVNNPKKLHKLDQDIFGFVCYKCNKYYCENCWQEKNISFDDVFFEDVKSTCPNNHAQLIQD